eukprot:2528756-Rhodomonas_salina.1
MQLCLMRTSLLHGKYGAERNSPTTRPELQRQPRSRWLRKAAKNSTPVRGGRGFKAIVVPQRRRFPCLCVDPLHVDNCLSISVETAT